MATNADLDKQRKLLEKLAKLKNQLAEVDLNRETVAATNLQKSINSVVDSLAKMGVTTDRIDDFYRAFVRANSSVAQISRSLNNDLLKSLNAVGNAFDENIKQFKTPIDDLKTGVMNVTQLMENAVKTSTDLESYATGKRKENTREFTESAVKITNDLTRAYGNLLKNEANLGTSKFKNLSVDKEIADTLLFIDSLDKMKLQLAGGYYSNLRLQATTVLEMLQDTKVMNEVHRQNNQLAKDAIKSAKEKKQLEEESRKLEEKANADKIKEFNKNLKFNSKILEEQQKNQAKLEADKNKAEEAAKKRAEQIFLKELKFNSKVSEEIAKAEKLDADKKEKALLAIFFKELKFNSKVLEEQQKNQAKLEAENKKAEEAAKKRAEQIFLKELKFNSKVAEEQEKARAKAEAAEDKAMVDAYLKQLKFNSRIAAEKAKAEQKEYDKSKKQFDSTVGNILNKLPGGSILTVLAKMGVVAQLLAVAVGTIAFLLLRWDVIVSNFTEKLSVTRAQAELTLRAAGGLADKLGLSSIFMEQIAEAIAKAQEGLGGMDISARFLAGNEFTERLVSAATVLSDTFGLTGQEIAGMTDASTAMGLSLSSNTMMVTAMSKGIMSANKLMQSLANLSPKLLTGFKGSNAQLVSMVTKMKLLGVEANNVVSSNDKLLDIESSITNAFEAQVATGAQINIDRLMALQMNGKYSDVLDEQLKTLQQSDYLNRGPLAQELIAQGIGLDRETASQMLLRKTLADKVGLTDELIRKRQQEGKLVEDDIRRAEKQGKITKMEADRLREISKEYDSKTIQEKFIRALNDFANSLSSTLQPLIEVLRGLTTGLGGTMQSLSSVMYGLGGFGQGVVSLLAGLGLIGAVGFLGVKAVRTAKAMGAVLRGRPSAAGVQTPVTPGASVGSAAAGSSGGILRNLKNMKGLKAAGILGGIGAAVDFGLNMSDGMSFGESAGRAGISGAFGVLGGILGGLVPVPGLNVATSIGGSLLGGFIGDKIGDAIFGQGPTAMASADAQFLQSQLGTASTTSQANYSAEAAQSQAMASELISTMKTISAKLDTANNVLSSINAKPSEVTVQLDGEKVGKAVVNYTSATMDRNRVIGNSYGGSREQTVYRSGK
jgi:hypothetical protein